MTMAATLLRHSGRVRIAGQQDDGGMAAALLRLWSLRTLKPLRNLKAPKDLKAPKNFWHNTLENQRILSNGSGFFAFQAF